jgi:DNA-binding GntR family transcriptional regulator
VPPEPRPTTGPTAAQAHRRGAEALASGRADEAARAFRAAVGEDPCFAMAYAGLAVALSELGDDERLEVTDALEQARRCSRRISRGERHHLEVVLLALRGDVSSASALAREHLTEFPGDAVVKRLLGGLEDH